MQTIKAVDLGPIVQAYIDTLPLPRERNEMRNKFWGIITGQAADDQLFKVDDLPRPLATAVLASPVARRMALQDAAALWLGRRRAPDEEQERMDAAMARFPDRRNRSAV